jgi:MYXO-CTERM domain-containing protein
MNAVATAGSTSNVYVTANNMYFGVTAIPAPGAAALLGLAALVSRRRR